MKRRSLCLLGGAAALGAPIVARAQGKKEARLCVLSTAARQDPNMQAVLARLSDLGWSAGFFGSGNLKIEFRQVEPETTDVAPIVDAVLRTKCDIVLTTNTPLAQAVKSAAPSTPLVFGIGGDPVALGLVTSLAKPGGSATGWTFASHESGPRMLSLLKELVPRATRIGVVFTRGNATSQQVYEALAASADGARVSLNAFPVRGRQDIHALDPVWQKEPLHGLIVPFDPITVAHMGDIVRLAALHRLPAVYGVRYFVEAGGLLSYGASWSLEVKRSADFAARILDGAKPADIPVETAQQFELLVNKRTARALGISIPSAVLAQATEVIE